LADDSEGLAKSAYQEAATAQADEIRQQKVEGERVTLVYLMNGLEPHKDCDPDECDKCDDLRLAAHKSVLAKLEEEMIKRGLK
jgi:hypothetical protein